MISQKYHDEDIYCVTFREYENLVEEQLPELPESNVLLEPFGRNTAPAILYALEKIKKKYNQNDIITVFPSDHMIMNSGEFFESLVTSYSAAKEQEGIISVGIKPSRPANQYGYIQIDEKNKVSELFKKGLRKAVVFAEKPDTDTAKRFIESGDFVWNSGIFTAKAGVLAEEFETHLASLNSQMSKVGDFAEDVDNSDKIEFVYKQINSISVDNGLLEKTDKLYVVVSTFNWSDLGTWDELYRQTMKDANNNVLNGEVIAIDTKNSMVQGKEKLIGLVGVRDLIVIESEEAIFICKRGESEKVKDLINYIRTNELKRLL